jgi:endonuclease/exonuclease/phosphatase family metal-dependent hydrolase
MGVPARTNSPRYCVASGSQNSPTASRRSRRISPSARLGNGDLRARTSIAGIGAWTVSTRCCVRVATVTGRGRELARARVHAPVIKNEVHPYLDRVFKKLEALFKNRSAIVGGDLNSSRLCEQRWPGSGHGPFFERIMKGPFVDCHWQFHRKEIQTFFGKNVRWQLQDDHIFASPDMARRFTSCAVRDNKTTRRLSDHIPIVAEIEI